MFQKLQTNGHDIQGTIAAAQAAYGNSQVSPPPPIPSVSELATLLMQQAHELCERNSNIACRIRGSIPTPNGAQEKVDVTLITVLQAISERLSFALAEAERAQQAL